MPFRITDLDTAYQGYSTIRVATLRDPEGATIRREIEDHGRAAAVLPYDPERRCVLLVRLPRPPVIYAGGPDELTEAAAGMIDEGETAEAAIRREALEELGVRLGDLEPIGVPFASPGVSTERIGLFLAPYSRADRIAEGGGADGEEEHITVLEVPLADLAAQAGRGEILDLKTLALVLALQVRRGDLFEGGKSPRLP